MIWISSSTEAGVRLVHNHLHIIKSLMMVLPFLSLPSPDVQKKILSRWLDIRSISNLDVALSSHEWRPHWLVLLCTITATAFNDWGHSLSSFMWLTRRGICVKEMELKIDAWQIRGCDLFNLKKTDRILHISDSVAA